MRRLGELLYRIAVNLNLVEEGTITSVGTTTATYDTLRAESEDYWTTGGLWALTASTSLSVFDYARITAFTNGDGKITHTALGAAIPANGRYAVARSPISTNSLIDLLTQQVNRATIELGEVPLTDVSLVAVSGDTEYTLPNVEMSWGLRHVFIQEGIADDNRWSEINGWTVQPPTTSMSGDPILILPRQYPAGYKIRLDWVGTHEIFDTLNDTLNPMVRMERVIVPATLFTLEWFKSQGKRQDWDVEIQLWRDRHERLRQTEAIPGRAKRSKLMVLGDKTVGRMTRYPGDRTPR